MQLLGKQMFKLVACGMHRDIYSKMCWLALFDVFPRDPLLRPRLLGLVVPLVAVPRPVAAHFLVVVLLVADEVLGCGIVRPKDSQMLVAVVVFFLWTTVLPFCERLNVPSLWYGSGSCCVMKIARSSDDSGVLKASFSSPSSSSSSRTCTRLFFILGGAGSCSSLSLSS